MDECKNTQITGPSQIESFTQFVGYSQTSNLTYTFNDTKSELLTQPSSIEDFCGEKLFNFTINSEQTNFFSGNNSKQIIFSPKKGKSTYGT